MLLLLGSLCCFVTNEWACGASEQQKLTAKSRTQATTTFKVTASPRKKATTTTTVATTTITYKTKQQQQQNNNSRIQRVSAHTSHSDQSSVPLDQRENHVDTQVAREREKEDVRIHNRVLEGMVRNFSQTLT